MDKKILYIVALILILVSCASISDFDGSGSPQDWTIFRGSPALTGYTLRTLPDKPTLIWSTSTQTRTVASPIVYNSIVYTLDRKGNLRGYDENGDSCFFYAFDTSVEASFIAYDSMIYVGRIDGYVSALSIPQKRIVWEYETLGQISGSPNIINTNETNLLVGSYDNSMYTFNANTGERKSQFETGYYINGTAAVWQHYMVFGGCDAWLRIVDTETGIPSDSIELDAYLPASPAIIDDIAYEADYNGNIYELHIKDGKFASHRKLVETNTDNEGEDGGIVSMPTTTHDVVVALTGERFVSCFSREDGKLRWKKMLRGDTGECSPLVCDDKVLVCTKDGHVSIFDIEDGKELWHFEAGESIVASPAIVAGRFYLLTTRGTLFCFGEGK